MQQGEFHKHILHSNDKLQVQNDLNTLLDLLEKNEYEIPSEISTIFRQIRPKVEKERKDFFSVSHYLKDDPISIDDDENANLLQDFF